MDAHDPAMDWDEPLFVIKGDTPNDDDLPTELNVIVCIDGESYRNVITITVDQVLFQMPQGGFLALNTSAMTADEFLDLFRRATRLAEARPAVPPSRMWGYRLMERTGNIHRITPIQGLDETREE